MLTDTPIPGVAGYGQIANSAKLAYQNALTNIGLKRQNMMRNYGYQADFDPNTGAMSNMHVDGSNQYGGLQRMLGTFAQDNLGARDEAIGRGLHGGLAHQAESALNYQHGGQSAAFGQQFANDLYGTQNDWYNATQDYNNTLYEAELAAARNAINNNDFNQGDYSGIDTSYPDGSGEGSGAGGGNGGTGTSGEGGSTRKPLTTLAQTRAAAIANAAQRAKASTKGTPAAKALAARSAGMNAAYGIKSPAKVLRNTYMTGQKKRG